MMKLYVCRVSELLKKLPEDEIYRMIPQYRRDRADACKNEAERKRSLAASYLLYRCMDEQGVSISETPCFSPVGKMYFPQLDRFYVNLSHAGDFAVCAYDEEEIGVDVERIRRYKETVIKRIGTKEEIVFFQELNKQSEIGSMGKEASDPEKKGGEKEETKNIDIEFTKFWTRKESAVKLTGRGIAELLNTENTRKKVFTKTYQPYADMFLSVSSYYDRFCQEISEI